LLIKARKFMPFIKLKKSMFIYGSWHIILRKDKLNILKFQFSYLLYQFDLEQLHCIWKLDVNTICIKYPLNKRRFVDIVPEQILQDKLCCLYWPSFGLIKWPILGWVNVIFCMPVFLVSFIQLQKWAWNKLKLNKIL
jgi:hypothetical protein